MSEDFKPLPVEFKKWGFTFRQVWREGQVAIFEQNRPEWLSPAYETIFIRVKKCPQFPQKPESVNPSTDLRPSSYEAYPRNEEWGVFGFTYSAASHDNPLESAKAKARELLERKAA